MEKLHDIVKGPAVAVDTVVMTVGDKELKVLLIKIGSGPYKDKWALPGGLVSLGEDLDQTVMRVLKQKTNIKIGHMEQTYTFGKVDRDVRGQVVSVAYMLLIDDKDKLKTITSDHYVDIQWFEIKKLPELAFDHKEIIALAYKRLCEKTGYSNIACFLSPKTFTLTELQNVYESILGRAIDKRNFRKKMLSLKMIVPTKMIRRGENRPAKVYRFAKEKVIYF